jgi:MFS family permease
MHRQVLLLATAQALFQTASVMVMTVGGLAGALIAPAPQWATAPIAAMFLGTALTTVPASMWMARVGRRTGFVAGALLGTAAGVLAALGIWLESLALLSLGTFLVGAYQAFAQFYRFAAGEAADEAFRPRAISLVLAGGIVAALLGPMLGRWGTPLLEPAYAGSFLLLALVSLLAAGSWRGFRSRTFRRRQAHQPPGARCGRSFVSRATSPRYSAQPPATAS